MASDEDPKPLAVFWPGRPRSQKRARAGRGRMYDPSAAEKREVRALLEDVRPRWAADVPLAVLARFVYPLPQSWPKAEKARLAGCFKTGTPDLDNLAKFLLDALNGLAWEDDRQVASLTCLKMWEGGGLRTGTYARAMPVAMLEEK